MVFPNNRIINKSDTNNSNNNSNHKINSVYPLQYPKNEEERWIVKQIKLLYSKLLIAHFNILKINANQRKELYEELLVKYKNFFGKDFIPEKEEESNTFSFNNKNQNHQNHPEQMNQNHLNGNIIKEQQLDKEIKRITIKNSIQSYVEDSSDEEAFCEHCDGPIEFKDTEMCECFSHPYCCEKCAVAPPDENDSDRYCRLCVPITEDKEDMECQNTNPIIPSSHSDKELTEKELRKLLGIEVSNDSTSKSNPNNLNDAPPPYSEHTNVNDSFANNLFINNEDIIAKEA